MISVESSTRKAFGVVYGVRLRGSDEYRYVGQTTKEPAARLRRHLSNARSGRKTPFYDWLRKHNGAVVVDTLDREWLSRESLGESEIVWIASLRYEGHRLLNIADGGLGPTGVVWTEEMREEARRRATGRKGVSRPGPLGTFYGRRHTAEQRAKWSDERKGTYVGPDNPNYGKFGEDHPSYGHKMSAESRAALSEMRKGERNPNFGKKASPETRAKMSAARKGVPRPTKSRSAHTRYHTDQGRFCPQCRFCVEDRESPDGT